jgi:hypothetical protein
MKNIFNIILLLFIILRSSIELLLKYQFRTISPHDSFEFVP